MKRVFRAASVAHYTGSNAYFMIFNWLPTFFHDNYPDANVPFCCDYSNHHLSISREPCTMSCRVWLSYALPLRHPISQPRFTLEDTLLRERERLLRYGRRDTVDHSSISGCISTRNGISALLDLSRCSIRSDVGSLHSRNGNSGNTPWWCIR